MPRKVRPLDRPTVVRDASLIVVASEDTHAVKQYFARFHPRRVQFLVLATEDGRSSPADVLARLDKYSEEYQVGDGDQLWLCLDTDHWVEAGYIQKLVETLRLCKQKRYRVAINHPCFELWLLLHFAELVPAESLKCREVVSQLRQAAGSYQKDKGSRLVIDEEMVLQAVTRARTLDTAGEGAADTIPSSPTTRVYLLVEELLARESIRLS